jgi:hypothetical protein
MRVADPDGLYVGERLIVELDALNEESAAKVVNEGFAEMCALATIFAGKSENILYVVTMKAAESQEDVSLPWDSPVYSTAYAYYRARAIRLAYEQDYHIRLAKVVKSLVAMKHAAAGYTKFPANLVVLHFVVKLDDAAPCKIVPSSVVEELRTPSDGPADMQGGRCYL